MTPSNKRASAGKAHDEQRSLAAGRAAGYCWAQNPKPRGRCTRSPGHSGKHKDVYAKTEW